MILHIGNGKTVRQKGIIGIFDLDNVTVCAAGREFISRATREKRVEYADDDIPRSFLLMDEGKRDRAVRTAEGKRAPRVAHTVLLSHISSLSLVSRAENGMMGEE